VKTVAYVNCVYSGNDRIEFEVEVCQAKTRAKEKLSLSPTTRGNFKVLELFCEKHGLDLPEFIGKLSVASEEPALSILGGAL